MQFGKTCYFVNKIVKLTDKLARLSDKKLSCDVRTKKALDVSMKKM